MFQPAGFMQGTMGAPMSVDQNQQSETMELLMKISLNNSQQIRDLNSVVYLAHLIKEGQHTDKAQTAGKAYAEGVKKMGANHQYGPPHPHKLWAFLEGAVPLL